MSIDFWEKHPNPELTFNIITNLKVPHEKFKKYIDRFGRMMTKGQLKRLQITGSIDAWGPQEEYVRWGLDLEEWTKNWEYLLDKPWVVQCINTAITGLTIKTLPELIEKIDHWNTIRPPWNPISFSFMTAMTPPQMVPDIFGGGVFEEDFDRIRVAMPKVQPHDTNHVKSLKTSAMEHMEGIIKQIQASPRNQEMVDNLKIYLNEIDRRRGTNWKTLFPWLSNL